MALLILLPTSVAACDSSHEAPASSSGRVLPASGLAAVALRDFTDAVSSGDEQGAAELAPRGDEDARAALAAVAHNADLLGAAVHARYLDEATPVHDSTWTADVALSWRFRGYDRSRARAEVDFEFRREGDRVAIVATGVGDAHVSPIWLREPVEVTRSRDTLVLAAGTDAAGMARTYGRRVRAAIPAVRRVLPRWQPRVVVEVPASAADLNRALGVSPGTYDEIAAVTGTADGSGRRTGPLRVYVNPEVTGRLRAAGAQVVLSHEVVHLATKAPNSRMDSWLLEGFADYVALRDVDLPLAITAARATAYVRRHGLPRALPAEADLESGSADLEAAYELSWLVCRTVVDEVGERGLIAAYDAALAGQPTDEALAGVGLTRAHLTRAWRARLAQLAS